MDDSRASFEWVADTPAAAVKAVLLSRVHTLGEPLHVVEEFSGPARPLWIHAVLRRGHATSIAAGFSRSAGNVGSGSEDIFEHSTELPLSSWREWSVIAGASPSAWVSTVVLSAFREAEPEQSAAEILPSDVAVDETIGDQSASVLAYPLLQAALAAGRITEASRPSATTRVLRVVEASEELSEDEQVAFGRAGAPDEDFERRPKLS